MGGRTYIKEEELTRAVLLDGRMARCCQRSISDLHNSTEYGRHRDRGDIGGQCPPRSISMTIIAIAFGRIE